jgi:hypothetical protein
MAQQGTSGKPPERRYDETVDPNNPPRAVVNPRVRSKALFVYLGGIVLLFSLVALTYFIWPGVERDVARVDTPEMQPVGTTGQQLPGGFRPAPVPGSTADELGDRGVGVSIRPDMPHLTARPVITRLRDITDAPPAELVGRRVELQDVQVQAHDGRTLWLEADDARIAVLAPDDVHLEPGSRIDVGGVMAEDVDGRPFVHATRIDLRELS